MTMPTALWGSVAQTVGMTISAAGFPAPVGALAEIERQTGGPMLAEVIGFRDELTILFPFAELAGIRHGNRVRLARTSRWLRVGNELLGRVLDAEGNAVDGKPQPVLPDRTPFDRIPPNPCDRPRIDSALSTGVRSIDGLLTCGKGQRIGIFAGSGVGKSVTLGMMARYTAADVIVIALIGERGREVNEFIQRDLGPDGMAKSVVVVATSNEPALVRVHAASTATAIAEYFRDQGKNVLLMMDSLTPLPWRSARSDWPRANRRPRAAIRPRCSPCCRGWWSAPGAAPQEASRRSTPYWLRPTIPMSRSATRCAAFWTDTSGWRAGWPRAATIRRSTCWKASVV